MWTGRSYCAPRVLRLLFAKRRVTAAGCAQTARSVAVHCALISVSLKHRHRAEQPKPRILVNSVAWAAGRKTLHMCGGSRAEVRPTVHARLRTLRRYERKHPKAPPGRRQWRTLLNACKCSCTVRALYYKALPITTGLCEFKVNKQGEKQHFQY